MEVIHCTLASRKVSILVQIWAGPLPLPSVTISLTPSCVKDVFGKKRKRGPDLPLSKWPCWSTGIFSPLQGAWGSYTLIITLAGGGHSRGSSLLLIRRLSRKVKSVWNPLEEAQAESPGDIWENSGGTIGAYFHFPCLREQSGLCCVHKPLCSSAKCGIFNNSFVKSQTCR